MAWRISEMAWACWASDSEDFRRIWIRAVAAPDGQPTEMIFEFDSK